MIKQLHKPHHQLHMVLTRLTLDIDVLVLFELPLSRSVFALVGLLILHFSVGNLSDFVVRFGDFSDSFGDFFKKKKKAPSHI